MGNRLTNVKYFNIDRLILKRNKITKIGKKKLFFSFIYAYVSTNSEHFYSPCICFSLFCLLFKKNKNKNDASL